VFKIAKALIYTGGGLLAHLDHLALGAQSASPALRRVLSTAVPDGAIMITLLIN
jgi:hypothetical protein